MIQHDKSVKELSLIELRKELVQLAVSLSATPSSQIMMSPPNLD